LESLFSYTYEDQGNDRIDLKVLKRIDERIENENKNKKGVKILLE
jgi:hypothetical protein